MRRTEGNESASTRHPASGEVRVLIARLEFLAMPDPSSSSGAGSTAVQDLTGTTVGRFAVRARLGAGGMGEVYRADDPKLKRPVALKRVVPSLSNDPGYRQRLLKEAERASALTHQHIAAVYDVLEQSDEMFLVMEYVEGQTLRERMKEPLGEREFYTIAVQCAEALAAAHEKGILHHDIKPENIMLTPAGEVKILDFGVARKLPHARTGGTTETSDSISSGFSGTPAYMAPEVLLERETDGRADLFSLGVVLFEALTGHHPFRADSFMATCDRILREAPPALGEYRPDLPPEVAPILVRLMEKQPERRFASATELAAALGRLQTGGEIPFPVAGPRARWSKPALWGAGGVAIAAAVSLALLLWPPTPPAFAERGWVLVGKLENRTGQAVFEQTLQEALTITLEQSRHLNVFPHSQTSEVLQRMKRDAAMEIDEALGREICQRENLQAVVLGSIGALGDDYVIQLRAVDPRGRVLFSGQKTVRGQKTVLSALDDLARDLRKNLGESLESVQKNSEPLEKVTSRSLEAIQVFSRAKWLHYAGNHGEAKKLLERAIELDPEFAVAHEGLASTCFALSQPEEGRRHLRRAVELSQNLTMRERHKILGDYHLLITKDMDQAIENFRALLALYPDASGARNNLALAYQEKGEFDHAAREAETTLRQRDAPVLRANLGYIHYLAGHTDRAIELQEENIRKFPDYKRSWYALGMAYTSKGDPERASNAYKKLAAMGGAVGTDAYLGLADLAASTGRYTQAREELGKAVQLKRDIEPVGEARARVMIAFFAIDQNQREMARRQAAKAASLIREPELLALAGIGLARAGDASASRSLLKRLEGADEKLWAALLRSELELAAGRPAAALEALPVEAGTAAGTMLLEARARAYSAAGRRAEEASAYEQVLARQGERTAEAPDGPAYHRVVQGYYHLGVAYAALQEQEKARKNLETFLRHYRDADANAPLLLEARQHLARLGGNR